MIAGKKVKEELVKRSEDGGELDKVEIVKEEVVAEDKVVNAPMDAGVDTQGQKDPL